MPWDLFGIRHREPRLAWLTLAFWLVILRGGAFVENFQARPPTEFIPDFFQDYASARNWFVGLPIYADLHETAPRHLAIKLNDDRSYVWVNAHPPPSVLMVMPFAVDSSQEVSHFRSQN